MEIDRFGRTATTRSAPKNSGAVFSFDLGVVSSPPNSQSAVAVIRNSSALQTSCSAILRENVNSESGMYWIMPEFSDNPIAAYCDMKSLKGGWQMCYTDWKEVDLKNSVFDASLKYGEEGYRSDCSKTPFDEIVFFSHDYKDLQAYWEPHQEAFQYQGRISIVAALSDWNGTALGMNGFPVSFEHVKNILLCILTRCSLQLVCITG